MAGDSHKGTEPPRVIEDLRRVYGATVLDGQMRGDGLPEGGLFRSSLPEVCGQCDGLRVYTDDAGSWVCGHCRGTGLEPSYRPQSAPIAGDDFADDQGQGPFPEHPAR